MNNKKYVLNLVKVQSCWYSCTEIAYNSTYQGSALDGIVPSHPIPSHGTVFRKLLSHGMGWDGTENFLEFHPTMGRRFFQNPIPSHGTSISVKILNLSNKIIDICLNHSKINLKIYFSKDSLSDYEA
jgi:hypothetical protein